MKFLSNVFYLVWFFLNHNNHLITFHKKIHSIWFIRAAWLLRTDTPRRVKGFSRVVKTGLFFLDFLSISKRIICQKTIYQELLVTWSVKKPPNFLGVAWTSEIKQGLECLCKNFLNGMQNSFSNRFYVVLLTQVS